MDIQRGRRGHGDPVRSLGYGAVAGVRVSGKVPRVLGSGVLQNMARGWCGFMEGRGSQQEVPWRGGEKRGRESLSQNSEKKRRFRMWVPHEVCVAKKSWTTGGRKTFGA
jgi:hypothetical protein